MLPDEISYCWVSHFQPLYIFAQFLNVGGSGGSFILNVSNGGYVKFDKNING